MSDADPEIEIASRSDVGRVRSENQDKCGAWSAEDGRRLLLVADGMGGHQGGARASEIAVEEVGARFLAGGEDPAALLREAFERANARIFSEARADVRLSGMGTTGVALLFESTRAAWVAHVGDSRAYRLRAGRLEALTADHNLMTQLMQRDGVTQEEAESYPGSQALVRALGPRADVDVEIRPVSIEPGDVFLLCSDGLHGPVPETDIEAILARHEVASLAEWLVDEANHRGGPDNVTVQVAVVPATPEIQVAPADPRGREHHEGPSRPLPIVTAASALAVAAVLLAALFIPASWVEFDPDAEAEPSSSRVRTRELASVDAASKARGVAAEERESAPAQDSGDGELDAPIVVALLDAEPESPAPAEESGVPDPAARPSPAKEAEPRGIETSKTDAAPRTGAGTRASETRAETSAREGTGPGVTPERVELDPDSPAAALAGVTETLAKYSEAYRACDDERASTVASPLALTRFREHCRGRDEIDVSFEVDEASLRTALGGRATIFVTKRAPGGETTWRVELERRDDGAWFIRDQLRADPRTELLP